MNLNENELNKLREWTNLDFGSIIFDSDFDNWSYKTSIFHQKLTNKSNIVILIETTDSITFGCYIESPIYTVNYRNMEGYHRHYSFDQNIFVFTFRNNQQINFYLKNKHKLSKKQMEDMTKDWFYIKENYITFEIHSGRVSNLLYIGNDINLYKDYSECDIYQNDNSLFDYKGIKNALIGKTGKECFVPKKILVIQMI